MCVFLSAIVTIDNIITSDVSDSHELLLQSANLPDDPGKIVRVEFKSASNEPTNLESYKLHIDQDEIPDWFESRKETVERSLHQQVKRMLLNTGKIQCLLGGKWILCGDVKIEKVVSSYIVSMYDSSQVNKMYGSSQVNEMYGSSQVNEMYGSSQVNEMYGSSQVNEMYNSSQVNGMYDSSQVNEMYGSSQVNGMYDSSQVNKMYDSSQVNEMYGSSQVNGMYDSSQVNKMYDSSQVNKMYNSSQVKNDFRLKKDLL
jgi:hypothetical protein